MDSFVIAGKAKVVFPLIALKAKREAALEAAKAIRKITSEARPCSQDPAGKVHCNVPYSMGCKDIDCPMAQGRHEASGE